MASFPLGMFRMNSLLILLLFSWFSYAVSTVAIQGGKEKSSPYGQTLTLRCKVTGSDTFNAWKDPRGDFAHNSSGHEYIKDGDTHKLKIIDVEAKDGGNWTCISNEGNSDYTTIVKVFVSEVPKGSAIKSLSMLKDSPGIIKVNILGYPNPTFEWKKDNKLLILTGRYSTAHNGSLLISKVDVSDKGTYSVTALQGDHEETITPISVTVNVFPTFISISMNEVRTRGGNITFTCNVTGIPTPNISWKYNSAPISGDARHLITPSGLTINDIKQSDIGDYICVASNVLGTAEQTSKLRSVLVPPTIEPIADREVEKGTQLKVYCNVSGDPTPDVEWTKNGSASKQINVNGGKTLTINNVDQSHSGTYECSAKNKAVDKSGKEIVRRQSMKVVVIYPPEFDTTSREYLKAKPNKSVEIKCNASGNPAPNLTLSFKNKDLILGQTSLSYSFNVKKADLGEYTCTAKNSLQEVKRAIIVFIPLDDPELFDVKPGCDKVNFSWSQDTQEFVTIESFLVTLNRSGSVPKNQFIPSNKFQSSFGKLLEGTEYNLSVKQEIEGMDIGHTSTKGFTTTICNPRKFNKIVIRGNVVDLYWPLKDNADHYVLMYRVKGEKWESKKVNGVTLQLTGLDYDATYEFKVKVVVKGKEKEYIQLKEHVISKDPSKDQSTTTKPDTTEGTDNRTTKQPPGVAARSKGLSGGAVAAIVIFVIALVLIAVDIFCCFFNQCGVVHLCAAACAGKSRSKYNVDANNPEEGTELKGPEESKGPEV